MNQGLHQGILGSVAKYNESAFRKILEEGFDLGAIEAATRKSTSASANDEAIQRRRIARMNAEYDKSDFKLEVPYCTPDTVWKLKDTWTLRIKNFRRSENLHATSHISYFLIGYAAGLFYGSIPDNLVTDSLDDLVHDLICQIDLYCGDARVRERALSDALKQLPAQNQSVQGFLIALKKMLRSCHDPVTILFLAACPNDAMRIRSETEKRALKEALQRSNNSEAYPLHSVNSCQRRDITDALRKYKPSILHFSGHAFRDGLVFENERGESDVIGTQSLASVMAQGAKSGLRIVVLSACWTAEQADCIANTVGCVIAMNEAVGDAACIGFTREFYSALAGGYGIDDAFEWASAEWTSKYGPTMIHPYLTKAGTNSMKTSEEALPNLRDSFTIPTTTERLPW